MCNPFSWIELEGKYYIITDAEIKSEKGKELMKESGSRDDIWGHGFCRKYYGLAYNHGVEKEIRNPLSDDFPKFIKALVRDIKKNFSYMFSMSGFLNLRGCYLKGITLPTSVGGSLDLRGCDLKGITLPTSVGGSLDLSGCDLKGINIPEKLKNKVIK